MFICVRMCVCVFVPVCVWEKERRAREGDDDDDRKLLAYGIAKDVMIQRLLLWEQSCATLSNLIMCVYNIKWKISLLIASIFRLFSTSSIYLPLLLMMLYVNLFPLRARTDELFLTYPPPCSPNPPLPLLHLPLPSSTSNFSIPPQLFVTQYTGFLRIRKIA